MTGNLGLGTQIWSVPQDNITTLLTVRFSTDPNFPAAQPNRIQLSYVEFLLYNWCEVTLRTSVLLFYIRVFPTGTGPRRIFAAILIVSDILSLGFLFFNIFQCTPISYFWLRWDGEHEGHCVDANKVTLSGGIIDLFWTLVILIIPLPYILRLQLPLHKKFAATVMFAWGIWCVLKVKHNRSWGTAMEGMQASKMLTVLQYYCHHVLPLYDPRGVQRRPEPN